jgi:hypothetical protein
MQEQGSTVLKFVPGTVLNDAQALAAKIVFYNSVEACQLSAKSAQKEGYSVESIELFQKQFSLLMENTIMISAVVVETLRAIRIWNTCLPLPGRQNAVKGVDEFRIQDPYIKQVYDYLVGQSDLVKVNNNAVTIKCTIDAVAAFKTKEELSGG